MNIQLFQLTLQFSMPACIYFGVGFPRPQENVVNNIPTVVVTKWVPYPPSFGQTGVSLRPWCCQAVVSGRRKKRSADPYSQTKASRGSLPLCSLSKAPHPQPPTPDRGIFSEAENPSHEQSSSTEVIKHGWFVVIDVVILPWTDPQTLKSTPMI